MWLGRYDHPRPLRRRGRFHTYAARERGAPVVVVVPADGLGGAAFAESLERLATAHAAVDSPHVARVRERGAFEGRPFVTFDSDAALDGETLIARLGAQGTRVGYDEAMAAVDEMTAGLEAAHDSFRSAPSAAALLGAFAWANVLVGREGVLQLYGFGHNVVAFDERGRPSGAPAVFAAPEVATGGPASPAADVYAFVAMQRALVSYSRPPPELRAALSGDGGRGIDVLMRWIDERVLAARPGDRATIGELRAINQQEVALLGLPPGGYALRRRLADLCAAEHPPPDASEHGELTVATDGSWFVRDGGERVVLGSSAARRILRALTGERLSRPGARLTASMLVDAGWPLERAQPEAGLNRLYVAVSGLRKLGLRGVLQRTAEGYRLAPGIAVRVVDPEAEGRFKES